MRIYTKKNLDKIENFIKNAVQDLWKGPATCSKLNLDSDLGIFVGWLPGYGKEDMKTEYVDDKGWGLNAGIKIRNDVDWTDYEYLRMPIWLDENGKETGEVAMTDCTISRDEYYRGLARYLLKEYIGMRRKIKKGKLLIDF